MIKLIKTIVMEGHGVASGKAKNSPYPKGTIEMQTPHFQRLGLDVSNFFSGTLNLSIAPYVFKCVNPEYTFRSVNWAEGFSSEDFSFSQCELIYRTDSFTGYIYYPHPQTKIGHFHSNSLIEVISEEIPGIQYGDVVTLKYQAKEIDIVEAS